MSQNGILLPPIEQGAGLRKGSSQSVKNLHFNDDSQRSDFNKQLEIQSPFKLPSDDEAFIYCQLERQRKDENKRGMLDQHIWEKKTATSKNSLKHYKGFQAVVDETHKTKTKYRPEDKKLIQNALEVCKKRKQNKDSQQKRESIVDVLEQKKEMFLVTMSHGIIEQEIERLKKIQKERAAAIKQSERLLQQDGQHFREYLDKNKNEKMEAEAQAEDEAKLKKQKEQDLKELNIKLTSIRAEKSRNEEQVANYIEHKTFLDKLASKEWQEEKNQKRQILIDENLYQWVEEQIEEFQQQHEEQDEVRKFGKAKVKSEKPYYQTQTFRKQKTDEYYEKARNNQLEFLQDFDDSYPLHFQNPSQLVQHFDAMEQKNLTQLSENQQTEETYEQTLNEFKIIEDEKKGRCKQLQEQKDFFKKQIEEVEQQIRDMRKKSEENSNQTSKEAQELTQKIEDLYRFFAAELPFISDLKSQNPITILSKVEGHMEKQLKSLKYFPIRLVEEQRAKAKKRRGANNMKVQQELREAEQKKKQKSQEKGRPVYKREGRKIMERSQPLIIEEKVEETQINDSDEEDKKYFQEGYVLL